MLRKKFETPLSTVQQILAVRSFLEYYQVKYSTPDFTQLIAVLRNGKNYKDIYDKARDPVLYLNNNKEDAKYETIGVDFIRNADNTILTNKLTIKFTKKPGSLLDSFDITKNIKPLPVSPDKAKTLKSELNLVVVGYPVQHNDFFGFEFVPLKAIVFNQKTKEIYQEITFNL